MAHLEEMGKILQSKPPRLEDVPRKPTLKKKAGPLEESAEEERGVRRSRTYPRRCWRSRPKGRNPPQSIEQALLQLTTIATKLTKADQKKDKLDLILEGGSGSAGWKRAEWSSRHEEGMRLLSVLFRRCFERTRNTCTSTSKRTCKPTSMEEHQPQASRGHRGQQSEGG